MSISLVKKLLLICAAWCLASCAVANPLQNWNPGASSDTSAEASSQTQNNGPIRMSLHSQHRNQDLQTEEDVYLSMLKLLESDFGVVKVTASRSYGSSSLKQVHTLQEGDSYHQVLKKMNKQPPSFVEQNKWYYTQIFINHGVLRLSWVYKAVTAELVFENDKLSHVELHNTNTLQVIPAKYAKGSVDSFKQLLKLYAAGKKFETSHERAKEMLKTVSENNSKVDDD